MATKKRTYNSAEFSGNSTAFASTNYTLIEVTMTLAVENLYWSSEDSDDEQFDHATGVVLLSLDNEIDEPQLERIIVLSSRFDPIELRKRAL